MTIVMSNILGYGSQSEVFCEKNGCDVPEEIGIDLVLQRPFTEVLIRMDPCDPITRQAV